MFYKYFRYSDSLYVQWSAVDMGNREKKEGKKRMQTFFSIHAYWSFWEKSGLQQFV